MTTYNIIILDTANIDKALRYAKAFCDRSQMYTLTYNIAEYQTVNRLFDYYLPLEHRMMLVIGANNEDIHRLMKTRQAFRVYFDEYEDDFELHDQMMEANGAVIDAGSLYEWLVSLDV